MTRGFLLLLLAVPLMAQTLDVCRAHRHHGRLQEASACFEKLAASPDAYLRAEGFWALGRHRQANDAFREAVAREPKSAVYRVRWGRLFHERMQRQDAAKLFQEALEISPGNPGALLGLALVASDGYERKAVELAERAAGLDAKFAEPRELLARLALEDGNPRKAAEEADMALSIDPESLDAMAIRAAIDWLEDKPGTPWIGRVLKVNPVYGEAYALAGHFLVLNRRYEEGIQFYRKALKLNPALLRARAELGVNLMRLGQDEEARWHLEYCYNNGDQYAGVVNPLRLLDSHKHFVVLKSGQAVLKLHKRDADLLKPYFEAELARAIRTYERKYQMRLDRPVELQVYPDHEDFAVRTLGMPGLGALGVTFGFVVAMDSPNGRKPGTFHWASTLWHELSHVFVLTATKHRVPRWFTEGMAVHEETAVSPDWGDRLSPEVIAAIREKKLLPIAQLDRGFLRPSYPAQIVVSYFQAGRICDFINEKWGYAKLLDMMRSFGERKTTPEVVEQHLGVKPEEFDQRFLSWLDGSTGKTVRGFDEWKTGLKAVAMLVKGGRHDDAIREGLAIRDIYPDFVENGSVYELLAEAYLAKGDKPAAIAELSRYAKTGGRSPETIKQLASLLEEAGKKREAAEALDRLNYIYPRDEDLHRRLGDLWLSVGDTQGAIREYQALVAMRPIDRATSHFSLARAYRVANRVDEAREQVLLSLEAAPGYRPAQKLLLELSQ
ncbi:MAG TPA: tetratricopeptide repeat protein [Bryobacteraceae bacterium]|nr:tetratricopeptide repeat protein [Bryobacteraceae bacterium]